ncbi:zinc finger MYM-type protein 1-like [Prunus persica]|uniref:zinc finger MYM-type protein 1-like n=1 Tax=Prunus persica TaxID=3760 RepID=UPI0009AB58AF|nr:zinc finger MYM-type protein 1-like [Prunus persica]
MNISTNSVMERYFKRRFASTTSSSDNVGSLSSRDVGISRDVDSSKEKLDLGCSDAFTFMGFRNWKKKDKIRQHVGAVGTSLDCVRFLLRQGLPFRGHDESDTSSNKGNYLELLQFLAHHDEKVKAVVLENAHGNLKLIAPTIQKDLVNACATETIKKIIKDMDGAFFSLLVDESRDVSVKEQMAVVFRYVDKNGDVIERFVGIRHVSDTTSNSLKEAIDTLFSREELSISMLRGQ